MGRKELGTKVLITIYDDKWGDMKKATIAIIEDNMTNNLGLFYYSPNFLMTI